MFKNEHVEHDGVEQQARAILVLLFRHRRLRSPACPQPCEACLAPHLPRVRACVARAQPVELVLPAFPAKSPNARKVLGRLPDLAETRALRFLQRLCDDVQHIHAPGARVRLCADGRVFADLVGITDEDVTSYRAALEQEVAPHRSLSLLGMEDLLGAMPFPAMRDQLVAKHGGPPAERDALWCGIHRFLFEDRVVLEPQKSRSCVRRECAKRASDVVQRSAAWSRLLEARFPHALRLSIHPQLAHAEKIGIRLADTDEGWLTPWHAVALREGGRFRLVHRHEAEALGARVVELEGRPSHLEVVS